MKRVSTIREITDDIEDIIVQAKEALANIESKNYTYASSNLESINQSSDYIAAELDNLIGALKGKVNHER